MPISWHLGLKYCEPKFAVSWFGVVYYSVPHGSIPDAGIIVAYSAPARHGCLKVVENNYCASRRGMFLIILTQCCHCLLAAT